MPKGAIQNNATAKLIGTNRCSNNWLGYGNTEPFSKGKIGYESEIYTSFVNGRPFIFEDVGSEAEVLVSGSGFGHLGNIRVAEKDWWEL